MTRALIALALVAAFVASAYLALQRQDRLRDRLAAAETRAVAAQAWELTALELQAKLAESQRQWTDLHTRNADALAAAERERQRIAAERDRWRERWESRDGTCAAALAALDTACPGLEDY